MQLKKKDNLLIILGPTAIGKSDVAINVAQKMDGEIISADSMQIYKYMDIGTAKVKPEEMRGIPHFLIDIVHPDEEFTVADFKQQAEKYIRQINNRDKLPIVVGGTGLYINSLVYELKFTRVKANQDLRNKYNELADKYGNDFIYNELYKIDATSAKKISPNDRKRIIRALEIYYETGKPMSYYNENFRKKSNKYNLVMIGLNTDRKLLYSRIEKRVDKMINDGLIDEVKRLISMGYNKNLPSMKAIGYKEIISYLEGELELNEAINILKRNTRRFAKRQLTWFKMDDRIKWININDFKDVDDIGNYIFNYASKIIAKN
ncbi:MAG: tRNA (adenosine(37)-N6)-dimethylallyltransferase MiaA [Tissierellia bacterium]|nr:tRNA (adenosine(37)-N6)-dimethylallyltransferase MiaA [Tissierellia bacterium]